MSSPSPPRPCLVSRPQPRHHPARRLTPPLGRPPSTSSTSPCRCSNPLHCPPELPPPPPSYAPHRPHSRTMQLQFTRPGRACHAPVHAPLQPPQLPSTSGPTLWPVTSAIQPLTVHLHSGSCRPASAEAPVHTAVEHPRDAHHHHSAGQYTISVRTAVWCLSTKRERAAGTGPRVCWSSRSGE